MQSSRQEYGEVADWAYRSAVGGIEWPAIHASDRAAVIDVLHQLEHSQWLAPERLAALQLRQLGAVVRHAHASVPFYRERWRSAYDPARELTRERLAALPLLTRRELQDGFEALKSGNTPAAHGAVGEARSSGSTGVPIRILKTQLGLVFWNSFALRDHLWHKRDLRGKLAAIRLGKTPGTFGNWGQATHDLVETGPAVVLSAGEHIETQFQWLRREQPDLLLTYPSITRELARHSLKIGSGLSRLREVRTFGELLGPETRELCRSAWNVPVTDVYSAEEVGYIALQCPLQEHYHVQSEGVLVEVLDERGRPCAPGEVGRVVVTTLHNFAMPLVRYDLGDFAEVGEPCACGRGLPVLRRITGRVRNMLVTAAGERYWPALSDRKFFEIAPVRQRQVVQKDLDLLEVRLVVASPLTPVQEERLRDLILSGLPPGFRLRFSYRAEIPRGAGGKFEDFVSEISPQS